MTSPPCLDPQLMDEELDVELALLGESAAQFLPVDTEAALDVEARIAETPPEKRTKGMFLEKLAREARASEARASEARAGEVRAGEVRAGEVRAGEARDAHYASFRDYPLRDFMRLLADYAAVHYPGVPVREAFRRAGSEAFSTLMSSLAGRALLVLARSDIRSALRLAPEAYKYNLNHCSVSLRVEAQRQAILEFREVWNFPECYHVGIIEGVCSTFGVQGRIRTHVRSSCDVDMLVRW